MGSSVVVVGGIGVVGACVAVVVAIFGFDFIFGFLVVALLDVFFTLHCTFSA